MPESNSVLKIEWEKCPQLAKTPQLEVFTDRFQKFKKNPEFLEFLDSDCRIELSGLNWVGKMLHIVILVRNGQIRRKIGNRLIKISWNQLIFLSGQSWLESHLYWIYSWFLKIPVATLLFGHFYGPIKWLDWPSFSETNDIFNISDFLANFGDLKKSADFSWF